MLRYLRRLAVFLVCLLLAFAMVQAAAPVSIRVWLPGLAPHREAIIRDFQACYPELRLNLATLEPAGFQEKLLAALVSKNAPDLCLVELVELGGLAEAGVCEPLDGYLADLRDLTAINPSFLRLPIVRDKVQGLPITGHPLALLFRQDWLTRLGLKPPTTWDEVAQVAEAFTRKDPDGNGKNDTWGMAERWPAADPDVARRFLPWLYQAGGLVATNQGGKWIPGFGLAGGVKALRFRRRLWESGLIPPSAPTNSGPQNLALFMSGQAGMIVENDRCVPAIRQVLGTKAVSVPLPRDIRMCTVGDGLCFVLSSQSNAKRAAFTFVQWWLSRETQQKLVLGWDGKPGGTGADAGALVLGPRQDVDPAALLGEPLYAGFVRSFPYMSPEPYCPNYVALRSIVARAVAAAMGSDKTVEEVLASGMKEAAAVLGQ